LTILNFFHSPWISAIGTERLDKKISFDYPFKEGSRNHLEYIEFWLLNQKLQPYPGAFAWPPQYHLKKLCFNWFLVNNTRNDFDYRGHRWLSHFTCNNHKHIVIKSIISHAQKKSGSFPLSPIVDKSYATKPLLIHCKFQFKCVKILEREMTWERGGEREGDSREGEKREIEERERERRIQPRYGICVYKNQPISILIPNLSSAKRD